MSKWVLILILTYPAPERGDGRAVIARGPLSSLEECLRLKPIEEHKVWPGGKIESWCVPLGGVNGQ